MSAKVSAMTVSTREFLRRFPAFRRAAKSGKEIVIESRDGSKFVFHQAGSQPRPRQTQVPLPKEVTDRWQVESRGWPPEEWEMNR